MGSVTNEVLASKIETLTTAVTGLQNSVVSKESLELTLKTYDLKIAEINAKILSIETIQTNKDKKKWIQNTLSGVLGAVLTGMIGLIAFLLQQLWSK